jgi:predicted nucleic acid-binding protein
VSGQVSYLLDTNILSETRKPKADPGVIAFLQSAAPTSVFISVLTIGELRKGIVSKKLKERTPNAAKHLTAWVEGLEASFADRILGIDAATARLWGDWSGERPRPVVDTLLAATAVRHELTLVTRNLRDVRGIPVKLLNPWTGHGTI